MNKTEYHKLKTERRYLRKKLYEYKNSDTAQFWQQRLDRIESEMKKYKGEI